MFLNQLIGDFYRYIAEAYPNEDTPEHKTSLYLAEEAYILCETLSAKRELPGANPTRLGLALNYAVFLYNVLDDKRRARQLAKEAIVAAEDGMSQVEEGSETHKEVKALLRLLKENYNKWEEQAIKEGENESDEQKI